MTSLITPQLNGESDNNYLIRFSSPLIWDKYSFIEMWIKQSYYSSGIRFIYKIDASGSIDEVKKISYATIGDETTHQTRFLSSISKISFWF